eukprot:Skav224020  [mRNA]  locus=scaffold3238:53161:53616:- [translate_table: standard]
MALQTGRALMSLAFGGKHFVEDAGDTGVDPDKGRRGRISTDSGETRQSICRRVPRAGTVPLPDFIKRELHGEGKCEPCVYYTNKSGCWYGDNCRYCHLCTPVEVQKRQSKKFYMERVQKREMKSSQKIFAQGHWQSGQMGERAPVSKLPMF